MAKELLITRNQLTQILKIKDYCGKLYTEHLEQFLTIHLTAD